jgi:hypothetical protein
MEKDDDGDMEVVGTKMKAEGETAYESHMLARFAPRRDADGGYIVSAFWEKDRSGILTGKTTDWPNYATIEPITNYLSGTQGTIGSIEESAEKDAAAIEAEGEKAAADRDILAGSIRATLESARTFAELKSAWSLTAGKKTKLGDRYEQLETIHSARKAEILKAAS